MFDRQATSAVLGLSFTQVAGWCSVLYLPAVLGRDMGRDLGLSAELVFGGVAVMYVVGALLAPAIGAMIDCRGARFIMAGGSLAAALGLLTLSGADTLTAFLAAWAILGLTIAAALSSAAYPAVAQAAGTTTRRAVSLLMFATGLAGTLSLPFVHLLGKEFGWRDSCLVLAAINLLLCVPIHLLSLRRRQSPKRTLGKAKAADSDQPEMRGWPSIRQGQAFWPLSLALAFNIFVTSGLALHLVGLLRSLGFSDGSAIAVASLAGPVQLAVRAVQVAISERWLATSFALIGAAALPLAMIFLLAPALSATPVGLFHTIGFVALFGLSNGLMVVARAAVPYQVFGPLRYGAWTGRLATPQNAATAITPLAFAAALENGGAQAALLLALLAGLVSLAAVAYLALAARSIAPCQARAVAAE